MLEVSATEQEKIIMTRKEATEGILASFYTLKGWFVKVKQAYAIDKVKFSFVEKGKHGSGFDVYVDIDEFDLLCDEILSRELLGKIQADNSPYPSAWKYVTGENACKEIAIGKGSKSPIVIQGRDKSKSQSAFIGILNYNELIYMAKWFRRTSKEYFEEMSKLVVNSNMYRPKEENKPTMLTFATAGQAEYSLNGYMLPVLTEDNKLIKLLFPNNTLNEIGNWQAFFSDASKYKIKFKVATRKMNNNYVFVNQFTVL